MKTGLISLLISASIAGNLALAQGYYNKGLGFVAPNVSGKANVYSPQGGEIVYDHSDGHFYGYDLLSVGWIDMNAQSVQSTASNQIANLGLATSVSSNALTIALKQYNGSDPASGTQSVLIGFKNSTQGQYLQRAVSGALSLVVSSGSTLGTINGVTAYLYVYAIDYNGAAELAISSQLFDDGSVVTTVAEGGTGTADVFNNIYSANARSGVPLRLIGRIKITESTAGTWASNASEIALQPFAKGEITSGLIAGMRIEAAEITSGGVVTEIGSVDWISGNCSNAAPYSCTINTGVFSGTPTCIFTANADQKEPYGYSYSSTGFTYDTYTTSTMARANGGVHVMCIGPR